MFEALPALSPAGKIQPTQLEKAQAPYRFNDQIGPSKPHPIPYIPSKPQLPSPQAKSKAERHYMWRILNLVDTTDNLEKDLMLMLTTDQKDLIDHLSALAKQEQEKTHLAEKAGQSMTSWSYLNRIASCLFAGATMAVGWYLTGNADVSSWISYGMIAAGAGSIGAMALAEMDIYPNLMRMMALGIGTLGLILGGGSSFAYFAGQLPDLLMQVTILGINAIYGMSTVGRSYRKGQLQWLMHEQFKARQKRNEIESKSTENAHIVEVITDRMRYINESAFRMLEEQDQLKRQMQRVSASAA